MSARRSIFSRINMLGVVEVQKIHRVSYFAERIFTSDFVVYEDILDKFGAVKAILLFVFYFKSGEEQTEVVVMVYRSAAIHRFKLALDLFVLIRRYVY